MVTYENIVENQAQAKAIANKEGATFTIEDLKKLKSELDIPLYKYLGWIAKNWDDINKTEIVELIQTYSNMVSRSIISDDLLQKNMKPKDLEATVNTFRNVTSSSERKKALENKIETIWTSDDGSIRMVVPETKEASIKAGRGSSWCTSYDDDNSDGHMFCTYVYEDAGLMIYIINDNVPYPYTKTAIRLSNIEYNAKIEEIRDMSNEDDLKDDKEYEEYLKKWDIPLHDMIDDIDINYYASEERDTHNTERANEKAKDIVKSMGVTDKYYTIDMIDIVENMIINNVDEGYYTLSQSISVIEDYIDNFMYIYEELVDKYMVIDNDYNKSLLLGQDIEMDIEDLIKNMLDSGYDLQFTTPNNIYDVFNQYKNENSKTYNSNLDVDELVQSLIVFYKRYLTSDETTSEITIDDIMNITKKELKSFDDVDYDDIKTSLKQIHYNYSDNNGQQKLKFENLYYNY